MLSYADETVLYCERGRAPQLSQSTANQNLQPRGPGYSVRVVDIHMVGPRGVKYQMHPVSSLYCSRMINRALGIIFDCDSREMPRELRCLFKISK